MTTPAAVDESDITLTTAFRVAVMVGIEPTSIERFGPILRMNWDVKFDDTFFAMVEGECARMCVELIDKTGMTKLFVVQEPYDADFQWGAAECMWFRKHLLASRKRSEAMAKDSNKRHQAGDNQ